LTLTDDQRQIVIRIIDTGIGVTSDFRAHLFEPFTKSDPHSPGAGLGLHITKTLVARMSGTLALIPNEGRCGSTFQVVLPVIVSQEGLARDKRYEIIHVPVHGRPVAGTKHRDSRSAGPAVPAEIAKPAQSKISAGIGGTGKSQTGRLRVLVVDDNIVNRKLLSLAIKKSPYAPVIYQAIDGENAIEMYRKIDPHLIFTDVSMPIMDGLTATSRIRELEEEKSDGTRCVIYALTGVGSNDVRLRLDSMMGKAALDGWLVKGEHDLSTIRSIISVTVERFALDDNAY
jgi:CheY-like chemotaxis protein